MTIQDLYLQVRKGERGIVQLNSLQSIPQDKRIYLWKGDITRLEIDAIVNAANKTLLGCMKPLHNCVDNAIHTYAGVQLRQACFELILEQGYNPSLQSPFCLCYPYSWSKNWKPSNSN